MEEVGGDGRAGEEVVGGGVASVGDSGGASAAGAGGEALHSLEVEPVLLEVARDVLAGQAVDAHELHYGLRDRVLDPEVGHGVDEPLVELWGPHEPGTLEGPGRLVSGGVSGGVEVGGVAEVGGGRRGLEGHRRRRRRRRRDWRVIGIWVLVLGRAWVLVWVWVSDVEGYGEIGGD